MLNLIGVARNLLGHGLDQLQPARLGGHPQRRRQTIATDDRHDHPQMQTRIERRCPLFRAKYLARFGRRISMRNPQLVHHGGRRWIGQQFAVVGRRKRDDATVTGEHQRLGRTAGLAQCRNYQCHFLVRRLTELRGHDLGARVQVIQLIIERSAPQVQASFKSAVDAHVEPRLDRARHELHRKNVDKRTRQHADQRKIQREPGSKARAELAPADLPPKPQGQRKHPRQQGNGHYRIEQQQGVVLLCIARRVACGPYQQPKQGQRTGCSHNQRKTQPPAHQCDGSLTEIENVKFLHGVASDQELLFRAST